MIVTFNTNKTNLVIVHYQPEKKRWFFSYHEERSMWIEIHSKPQVHSYIQSAGYMSIPLEMSYLHCTAPDISWSIMLCSIVTWIKDKQCIAAIPGREMLNPQFPVLTEFKTSMRPLRWLIIFQPSSSFPQANYHKPLANLSLFREIILTNGFPEFYQF